MNDFIHVKCKSIMECALYSSKKLIEKRKDNDKFQPNAFMTVVNDGVCGGNVPAQVIILTKYMNVLMLDHCAKHQIINIVICQIYSGRKYLKNMLTKSLQMITIPDYIP